MLTAPHQKLVLGSAGWLALGILGAAVVGGAALVSPIIGLAVATMVAGGIAAGSLSRSSSVATYSVVVALLVLTIFPERVFGTGSPLAAPELTKVVLLICWIGAVFMRGVVLRALAPALLMIPLAFVSHAFGKPPEALTTVQGISSLVTLSLAWAFLAIRWRKSDAILILRWITYMAPISVGLGVLLDAAGLISLYRDGAVARLAGASIAALLGGIGAAGIGAAVTIMTSTSARRSKLNLIVFVADWLIVFATASRGPLLIALILTMPWIIQFMGRQSRGNAQLAAVRIAAAFAVVLAAAALVIPSLQARNESKSFNTSTNTVSVDPTSGRLTAWKEFYELTKPSPIFGLGVGAGPVVQIGEVGFKAQHNEYLRAYLETGAVGLVALLLAAVYALRSLLVRVPKGPGRGLIRWQIAAFAVYSFTDNTLSSPYLAVPFMTLFATTAAVLHVTDNTSRRRVPASPQRVTPAAAPAEALA